MESLKLKIIKTPKEGTWIVAWDGRGSVAISVNESLFDNIKNIEIISNEFDPLLPDNIYLVNASDPLKIKKFHKVALPYSTDSNKKDLYRYELEQDVDSKDKK